MARMLDNQNVRLPSWLMAVLLVLASGLAGCMGDGDETTGDGTTGGDGTTDGNGTTDGDGDGVGDGADGTGDGGTGQAVQINVTARDSIDESRFWFEIEGMEGENPTLMLPAGAEVTIFFLNEGEAQHNIHIGGPIGEATDVIASGESAWLNFTVPDDANAEDASGVEPFEEEGENNYWCDPHVGIGMKGPMEIQADGTGGTTDGNETTSGNETVT